MHELKRFLVINGRQVNAKLTAAEVLALQVVHGNDEQAMASWKQFRNDGFDIDSLYLSTGKVILPMLSERISVLVPEDPWLGKMKGYCRYTWTRNAFLLNTLKSLLTSFREHNIKSVIFGDAALLLGYYKVLGMRPIDDLALLVNESDLEHATELAQQLDIREIAPRWKSGKRPLRICRSMHEVRLENLDVDSVNVQFSESEFPILNATKLLLVLFLDMYYFEINQLQWFIDTALVLNSCSTESEIEHLMHQVKSMRMATPVLQVLSLFRETAQSVYFDDNGSKVGVLFDAISPGIDELAQRAMKHISV